MTIHKELAIVGLVTAGLLLIPAIAMQWSGAVAWGPGDFVVAALLLMGAGSAWVFAARALATRTQRIIAALAFAFGLVSVWAELAVGLFH